jgi:hypothetical protein
LPLPVLQEKKEDDSTRNHVTDLQFTAPPFSGEMHLLKEFGLLCILLEQEMVIDFLRSDHFRQFWFAT